MFVESCLCLEFCAVSKTDYFHFYMPNMGLKTQMNKIKKADYLFKSTNASEEAWAIKLEICWEELRGHG